MWEATSRQVAGFHSRQEEFQICAALVWLGTSWSERERKRILANMACAARRTRYFPAHIFRRRQQKVPSMTA